MLTDLENKHFNFTYDELNYTTTYKHIAYVAVLFGMAVSLVSTIIGLILSGPLALITIVASPLLVSYLVLEMKDKLKPMFVQKMCSLVVVDENGVDADPTETPAQ
ncbi:hypothetical protein EI165_08630 [Pseudoalteromonas nigrifaciens]|uniref:hypothetical protein n=1 Tax=Pseudoalteromonas nigrifaciens TaxID=28109 RepID=UPI001787B173|nr:hypothetical protein [Pseudoalteromonas nigrifaciens]MBE0420188.1 hypothetical protein [Pseudoalteromonas nigrifaciens]